LDIAENMPLVKEVHTEQPHHETARNVPHVDQVKAEPQQIEPFENVRHINEEQSCEKQVNDTKIRSKKKYTQRQIQSRRQKNEKRRRNKKEIKIIKETPLAKTKTESHSSQQITKLPSVESKSSVKTTETDAPANAAVPVIPHQNSSSCVTEFPLPPSRKQQPKTKQQEIPSPPKLPEPLKLGNLNATTVPSGKSNMHPYIINKEEFPPLSSAKVTNSHNDPKKRL